MEDIHFQESLTETVRKTPVQFPPKMQRDFLTVVRHRVAEEMKRRGLTPYATYEMWLKTFMIITLWIIGVGLIYADVLGAWGILAVYAFLGGVSTLNGLNIAHDANHRSTSKKLWVNDLFASFFDLNGTSSAIWRISHNEGHHVFTNIPGKDLDVDKSPFLRLSPADKLEPYHKYQHLYAPILYCFSTINWVFISDYVWFFKALKEGRITLKTALQFWSFKIVNLLLLLVIPLLFLSGPWWAYVVGLFLLHAVAGFTSALVFQMGHVVEGVDFVIPDKAGNLPFDWSTHEMRTTSNFGIDSAWVTFWTGGLNYQIEHHLFPNVCHVHYRWIGPIVQRTAEEFDLPYHNIPTFRQAIASHFRLLKRLGNKAQWNYARPSHFRTRQ